MSAVGLSLGTHASFTGLEVVAQDDSEAVCWRPRVVASPTIGRSDKDR